MTARPEPAARSLLPVAFTRFQIVSGRIGAPSASGHDPMEIVRKLDQLIDWFTPPDVAGDLHAKKRVRMFLISHLFGPVLGAPIPIFLYANDPQPWPHVHILALSIAAFWL